MSPLPAEGFSTTKKHKGLFTKALPAQGSLHLHYVLSVLCENETMVGNWRSTGKHTAEQTGCFWMTISRICFLLSHRLCNRGLQVLQEVPLSWAERVCDSQFQCPFILSLSKGMLCKEWICSRNGCHDSLKEPASTILANNLVGQAHE